MKLDTLIRTLQQAREAGGNLDLRVCVHGISMPLRHVKVVAVEDREGRATATAIQLED